MREERPGDVAVRTYLYLRLGMVAAIILIGVSVLLEMWGSSGCFQKSFSAYYYTPARGVFVGGLVAVALGMIVVWGSSVVEDAFLNLGGLLVPIVAFVPTGSATYCSVVGPAGNELDELSSKATAQRTADQVVTSAQAAIDNNVAALLWVVGIALIALIVLVLASFLRTDGGFNAKLPRQRVYVFSYVLASLFWLATFVIYWKFRDEFYAGAHFTAAVLLFACIFIVVLANAFERVGKLPPDEGALTWLRMLPKRLWMALRDRYGLVVLGMVVSVIFVVTVGPSLFPDHRTLVIEALLFGLFGLFWVLQTVELRKDGLRVVTTTSEGTATHANTTSQAAGGAE